MTQIAAGASLDEDAWDDLLNYIEERRVIPIIGPDLLRVQTDRGLRPLYEWLAEKLAVRLSVDPEGLPQPLTLNDVVCAYLGQRGRQSHDIWHVLERQDYHSSPAMRLTGQRAFDMAGIGADDEFVGQAPGARMVTVAVRRVDDEHVGLRLDQRRCALEGVGRHA